MIRYKYSNTIIIEILIICKRNFSLRKSAEKIANFAGPLRKVLGKGVADGAAEEAGLKVYYRRCSGYTL